MKIFIFLIFQFFECQIDKKLHDLFTVKKYQLDKKFGFVKRPQFETL